MKGIPGIMMLQTIKSGKSKYLRLILDGIHTRVRNHALLWFWGFFLIPQMAMVLKMRKYVVFLKKNEANCDKVKRQVLMLQINLHV